MEKIIDLFLAQLDAEAARTRRTLERIPEGRDDWKPHEKSMPLGRLAMLVARMPMWTALIVKRDELDLNRSGGSNGPSAERHGSPERQTGRRFRSCRA